MAFTENLDVFLADFGVSCTAGAVTALGILNMPGEVLMDGMVISTDYSLIAKAEDFGDLLYGSQISVNGVPFSVREATLQADGRMVQLSLQRSTATQAQVAATAMDGNDADLLLIDAGNPQLDADFDGGSAGSVYIDGNDYNGGGA
jgi:hypothetical protein